jgi:putative N6-adenine-specific DNA methylase
MGTAFKGIALCAVGLEKITAQELVKLGLKPQDRRPGRIGFALESDRLATDLARANIGLRTAERVLLELGRFPAPDFDAYFEGIASRPWAKKRLIPGSWIASICAPCPKREIP